LSVENSLPSAQAKALLDEIEQQTRGQCTVLLAHAEQEARDLIAHAHATARRHAHDALAELRREGARRVARARAQAETDARYFAQRRAAEVVRKAFPLLAEALIVRWQDPAARAVWTESAARQARDRIRSGSWSVEHPVGWTTEEQRVLVACLGGDGASVTFTADPDIAAGIRIKTANATLDATSQGLIADHGNTAALLLDEWNAHE
jgi:vacuolar-type H+-ATPase subunit H